MNSISRRNGNTNKNGNTNQNGNTHLYSLPSLYRGMYNRIAVKIGCDPSYVSRVARGERRSTRSPKPFRWRFKKRGLWPTGILVGQMAGIAKAGESSSGSLATGAR